MGSSELKLVVNFKRFSFPKTFNHLSFYVCVLLLLNNKKFRYMNKLYLMLTNTK